MEQKKLSDRSISVFCGSISMLLHAGMYAQEAAALFAKDGASESTQAAKAISDAMEEGLSFADAAEKTGAFPSYSLHVFQTAEYSGRLEEGLERLAVYYDREHTRKQHLRSTLTYPAALLLMMCGVLAVLVFFVLPMFQRVYSSLTGSLAASSYAYVLASGVIARFSLVLAAGICLGLLAVAAASGSERGQQRMKKWLEKQSATRQTMFDLAVSSFADTLATLLSSGMDMDSAMEMAKSQTDHAVLSEKLAACQENMARGAGLADAMYSHGIFSALYGRMLVSGAASGSLETALAEIAEKVNGDAQNRLTGMMDSVEPMLIGFLAVSVGLTLLSVMLPLLGILGAV